MLVGHPFDTIKVRLQTEGTQGKFAGPIDCLKQTIVHEGVRGVYKGMSAPLLATGAINSVLFGVQWNIASQFAKLRERDAYRYAMHLTSAETNAQLRTTDHVKASFFSGFLISFVVTPVEGVKARLQVQYKTGAGTYKGPLDCAKRVYRELGLFQGVYRGWLPVCFCRMSNYSYFGSYALLTDWARHTLHIPNSEPLPMLASVLAGGLAGLAYWMTCYPMDVVKNRIQSAPDVVPARYSGTVHAIRTIYRTEGWRAFFAGFSPCALRAFPANSAAFCAFELAMRVLPEKL